MERTLIIIKPDGMQRALATEILGRFERRGFRLVGLKVKQVDRALAERHYAVHQGKPFYESLISVITSGPVLVAALEGPDAIKVVRTMLGSTRPAEAAPGTIRGDYGLTTLRNLMHASDGSETAREELALWFRADELVDYRRDIDTWIYE